MTIPLMKYGMDPVYTQIAHRFRQKYNINLTDHIDSMNEMGDKIQDGFWFTPKDSQRLITAIMATKAFIHDDRSNPFHALAAFATEGEGYREISDTSLHCQIGDVAVNMHIDNTGFIWRGPDGKGLIGPDAIFHIMDELDWPKVVKWVSEKSKIAGMILQRLHPDLPRSATHFIPAIGATFDLIRDANYDLSSKWSLSLNYHWGCTNYECVRTESFTGLVFNYTHR